MKTYCSVCKKLPDNTNIKNVENKGKLMMKSTCLLCGNKRSRFILHGSGLFDSLGLNTPQNRIKKMFCGMVLDNKIIRYE